MSAQSLAISLRKPACGVVWLLGFLVVAVLMGGCGPRSARVEDPIRPVSGLGSYNPEDDGIALTPAEQAALHTTGQLDRGLSDTAMRDVTLEYKYFLHQKRRTMERFSQQARTYLGHARKVFRDRGMPEELACLAIVESGYNPNAVSPAGAAGAWQFMPYTGMKYGLNQDWWMDERRDPYKSAEAAADYLKKLHGDFNDWHLAIAAYNAGEGKIGRALEKTGATSFFALKEKNHLLDEKARLREETKQYVPRFLAVCKIMRNLEKLGFAPCDYTNPPSVVRLDVRPGTDLMALSKAVGMSWEEFSSYNGAHKRYVSSTDRSTSVYLPAAREKTALAHLNGPRKGSFMGWQSYTASRGDSWRNISRRSGVPVAVLQSANRNVPQLKAGMTVLVPGGAGVKKVTALADAAAPSRKNGRERIAQPLAGRAAVYTLKAGDTLYEVARNNNTSVDALLAANDVDDPHQLKVGRKLRIPGVGGTAPVVAAPRTEKKAKVVAVADAGNIHGSSGSLGTPRRGKKKQTTYTVQPGDTVWGIARKHNVPPKDLMQWNTAAAKGTLRPGDTLVLAGD